MEPFLSSGFGPYRQIPVDWGTNLHSCNKNGKLWNLIFYRKILANIQYINVNPIDDTRTGLELAEWLSELLSAFDLESLHLEFVVPVDNGPHFDVIS